MRFATLGLYHEANTFSPLKADRRLFESGGVVRDAEIIRDYAESATTLGGYFTAARQLDIDIEPILFAFVTPIGAITEDAFEWLVGEMLAELEARGPWDGVLLNLHGAAVAEHLPDVDGEIASRVRAVVGPDVPVGAVLDLHANVSRQLVEALTVTLVYQTNPHVDARERGIDCTKMIAATVRGEIRPQQALVPLPLVVNIARQDTDEKPMAELMARARAIASWPGLLSASVVEGFPYADVPHMGMSCIAIHDGGEAEAEAAAQELASQVWKHRAELQARERSVHEALELAAREPSGPVVLLDVGDNIGGGAPGDSTVILRAALDSGARPLVQTLSDPESVRRCIEAGVGAGVNLHVGAKNPHSAGKPVEVRGTVRTVSDGRFEEPTATHGGFRFFDQGPTAVLDTVEGHTLVLGSKAVMNSSLQQLLSVGVDPGRYHIVVAKGVNSPRASYGTIARRMVVVDTEGITAMNLERFTYQHRRKPLYPFEAAEFPE
ncbi:M81 family metallopeptidase [Amycolatopsis endophytica]|uniref:Microcystin degradation protein MlrC n=1 Tax=Amycolatopsis endophytica TaxID=860233 RepID=A0A853AZK7_9PSEU|nr:M81 family metallopeptidase [Amycolatopsis endophytica]NYI88089.1 microcystin degradation protein MlrC [Amycolatopsis endophytica]